EASLDRIMVETDCPYLAPQKYRGKRNEPAFVAEVVRCIADEKKMDFENIAEISRKNSVRFFEI
ncbi:TatD family hydrolase, partial [Candidatus Peregrinibacteria bacterium]|nr:TatD family hydrolase [Candidatus Peregrinibacteria bacterium]